MIKIYCDVCTDAHFTPAHDAIPGMHGLPVGWATIILSKPPEEQPGTPDFPDWVTTADREQYLAEIEAHKQRGIESHPLLLCPKCAEPRLNGLQFRSREFGRPIVEVAGARHVHSSAH